MCKSKSRVLIRSQFGKVTKCLSTHLLWSIFCWIFIAKLILGNVFNWGSLHILRTIHRLPLSHLESHSWMIFQFAIAEVGLL